MPRASRRRGGKVALCAAAIGLVTGMLVPTVAASADTAPAVPTNPRTPATVSSDSLPVPQIGDGTSDGVNDTKGSGVVWDQVVIGDTVYVGGSFQFARPSGAKAGEQVVPRANFLAYNLKTGALLDFAPSFNGQIRSLAASPDGTRLYVGGSFTQVDGVDRYRLAAFDMPSGSLNARFAPSINATVADVSASDTAVYVAGALTSVQKQPRQNFAAVDPGTGAALPWAPKPAAGGGVTSVTGKSVLVSPDGKKVVVSGSFWTMNGSSQPGRGMAALDATTAAIMPWKVNSILKNGTTAQSSFMDLTTDGTSVYGAGFQNGPGDGLFEGTFRASWADGSLQWMTNCHGDSYSIAASEGAVYTASHAHYCGGIGAFADGTTSVSSDQYHRGLAFSLDATQKLTAYTGPNSAYNSHTGQPGPSLLDWYPDFPAGKFTGMTQGPWDVTTAQGYVLYAGEFPQVNGAAQRGLARFAPPAIAPNKDKPQLTGAAMNIVASTWGRSYVKFTWPANYDRDNAMLRYQLIRDGRTDKPVFETTVESRFWQRPTISAIDGYLEPGSTHTYQLRVTDPFGNASWSNTLSYTAPASTAWAPNMVTPYDKTILQQQPESYWSMNELNGTSTTIYDWTGANSHLTPLKSSRVAGVDSRDTGRAVSFATGERARELKKHAAPNAYSSELWFQSTSKTGGTLLAFVNEGETDRVVKLDADGRLSFWVWPHTMKQITSPKSYTDGAWHHVVATLGPTGTQLYLDGQLVASDATSTTAYTYPSGGGWALGGAAATLDNAAVWHRVLSASEVNERYRAGGAVAPTAAPVASFTSSAKELVVSVDGSGSSDPDGKVASFAWDFGDGSTGTGVQASHTFAKAGTYTITLTVTDDKGGKATVSKSVTVSTTPTPPAPAGVVAQDSFERSSASGWGSAVTGGAWTSGKGSTTSVGDGAGKLTGAKGQTSTVALPGATSDSSDTTVSFRVDNAPTGGGQHVWVTGRQVGADSYTARVLVQSNGVLQLQLQQSGKNLAALNLPDVKYTAGEQVHVRFQVTGTGTTTLQAKVWTTGAEPAGWTKSVTDTTAALQAAGSVGLGLYVSGSATAPSTVSFDDYVVKKVAP